MTSQNYPVISLTIRVMIILHLCITFSVLCFYLLQPFVEKSFEKKELKTMISHVINNQDTTITDYQIPSSLRERLIKELDNLNATSISTLSTLKEAFQKIPSALKLWMIISLSSCLGILFRIRYSYLGLLATTTLFTLFVFIQQDSPQSKSVNSIWPQEHDLLANHSSLKANSFKEQHDILEQAWDSYLLQNYLPPNKEHLNNKEKKELSSFYFDLERTKLWITHKNIKLIFPPETGLSTIIAVFLGYIGISWHIIMTLKVRSLYKSFNNLQKRS